MTSVPPLTIYSLLWLLCVKCSWWQHSLTPLSPASWGEELSLLQFGALPVPGCAFLQYSMCRRRRGCNWRVEQVVSTWLLVGGRACALLYLAVCVVRGRGRVVVVGSCGCLCEWQCLCWNASFIQLKCRFTGSHIPAWNGLGILPSKCHDFLTI